MLVSHPSWISFELFQTFYQVFRKDCGLNLVTTLVPETDATANKRSAVTGSTFDGVSFSVTLMLLKMRLHQMCFLIPQNDSATGVSLCLY